MFFRSRFCGELGFIMGSLTTLFVSFKVHNFLDWSWAWFLMLAGTAFFVATITAVSVLVAMYLYRSYRTDQKGGCFDDFNNATDGCKNF